MKPVVFWQHAVSPHQAPLLASLAQIWTESVILIADDSLPDDRRTLGWEAASSIPGVSIVLAPTATQRVELESELRDAHHIISGWHAYPGVSTSTRRLLSAGAEITLYAEPYDPRGLRGAMRLARARARHFSASRHVRQVLCVGSLALTQFARLGYAPDQLRPFAYFGPQPPTWPEGATRHGDITLAFVGELSRRKEVHTLLHALHRNADSPWSLTAIGTGAEKERLQGLSASLGLDARVTWAGPAPMGKVLKELQGVDALILPSAYDGWGMVVNEALAVGAYPVVSSTAGASAVISDQSLGLTFEGKSVEALAGAIRSVVTRVEEIRSGRGHRRAFFQRSLSGPAGAAYLGDLLRECRVSPPWTPATDHE